MKKSGLKYKLFSFIKEKGYVTYGDVCQFTVEEGYKVATAERRLRYLMAKKDENGVEKEPMIFKEEKNPKETLIISLVTFSRGVNPSRNK